MTSPDLGSAQLPALMTTPVVAGTTGGNVGVRPVASSSATTTQGTGFSHLMNLQGRGRELEQKLAAQTATADAQDPAAMATADQATFMSGEVMALRELVGPAPGGNARRALAAILQRLEAGGEFQVTDRTRIRLAIAADEKRVGLAGANAYRHAILEVDRAVAASDRKLEDPTMLQDRERMATFQQHNRELQQLIGQLQQGIDAPRVDEGVAHRIASQAARASGSRDHSSR